jgi:hypothetical protein
MTKTFPLCKLEGPSLIEGGDVKVWMFWGSKTSQHLISISKTFPICCLPQHNNFNPKGKEDKAMLGAGQGKEKGKVPANTALYLTL